MIDSNLFAVVGIVIDVVVDFVFGCTGSVGSVVDCMVDLFGLMG